MFYTRTMKLKFKETFNHTPPEIYPIGIMKRKTNRCDWLICFFFFILQVCASLTGLLKKIRIEATGPICFPFFSLKGLLTSRHLKLICENVLFLLALHLTEKVNSLAGLFFVTQ